MAICLGSGGHRRTHNMKEEVTCSSTEAETAVRQGGNDAEIYY